MPLTERLQRNSEFISTWQLAKAHSWDYVGVSPRAWDPIPEECCSEGDVGIMGPNSSGGEAVSTIRVG